ncbi:hypothetical protein [Polystyrenella longa]|uniref:hypothetical protein n=1 Tax=Polystyrenella longa TaxID=2528007 RepID=UPI0011A44E1E|nr:hypothetical protein [Polystyrenella longa]
MAKIVRHKIAETVVPTIVGLYFLILDVWGDEFDFIKDNLEDHKKVFFILVSFTVALLFYRGVGDFLDSKRIDDMLKLFSSLFFSIENIIGVKKSRFSETIATLDSVDDTFERITHPKKQIKAIISQANRHFVEILQLKRDAFDFTIMRKNPITDDWYYLLSDKAWQHTEPSILLEQNSSAAHCLRTGEKLFLPDKKFAAKNGEYYLSERDKRNDCLGSVFCKSYNIKTPTGKEQFIVTITTYGVSLCGRHDRRVIDSVESMLGEFALRIELELILFSLKEWLRTQKEIQEAAKEAEKKARKEAKQRQNTKNV